MPEGIINFPVRTAPAHDEHEQDDYALSSDVVDLDQGLPDFEIELY